MVGKYVRLFLQSVGLVAIVAMLIGGIAIISLGAWLQYQDQPLKSDYVLPLAGDGDRLLYAIELYKQGYAPKILLGNDRVQAPTAYQKLNAELGFPSIDPRERRRRLLDHLKVPNDDITFFGHAYVSTLEEAEELQAFLGKRDGSLLIVTSPYHTRRAKLIFQSVMPQRRILVVASPEGRLASRWWDTQESALQTVLEAAKLVYFWIGGAFRNPARADEVVG